MPSQNITASLEKRTLNLKLNPIKGNFDVAHLKAIHAYLFQDYPNLNPGMFRPHTNGGDWYKQRDKFEATEKGIAPWVAYSHMDKASQEKLSEILESVDPTALSKLSKPQFIKEITSLYATLDYIHPFLEGNSRTLREFTRQLSEESGYDLRWERFNRLAERNKNRELLYIARDLAIYEMSLQNIKTDQIREYVQGSKDYFEDKGYQSLETLLHSAVTAKDYRLNRDIEHLLSPSQNQSLPSPTSNSKEESAQAMPSASTPKTSTSSVKQSFAEEFASKIIEQLDAGTAPWIKPFEAGELDFPYNGKTEDRYRGSNVLRLVMENRSDPRWLTYKQAQEMGAQVRKGEKATRLLRMVYDKEVIKKDENGKVLKGEDGKALKERVKLDRPFASSFVVFNAEQIDNLPDLVRPEPDLEKEFKANQRAEAMLKASNAHIEHKNSGRAFYSPREDKITLPEKTLFQSESGYYSTALHELGHWTGHESRLNRDLKHPFGSVGYAKEELKAEIASWMLAMELGTGFDPGNHAAYIQSWVKILRNDPEEIFRAASDAEKIKEMVMGFESQIKHMQSQEALREDTFKTADLETKEKAISLYNERHNLTTDDEVQLDDDGEISIAGGSDEDFEKIYAEIEQIAADLQPSASKEEFPKEQRSAETKPSLPSVKDLGEDHFKILAEDILHYTKDFSEKEEASPDSFKGRLLDAAASDFIELDKDLAYFDLDTGDKYQAVQKFAQKYEKEFKEAANKWIEAQSGLIPQIYDLNAMKEGLRNLNLADEADYISAEISAYQAPLASERGKAFKGVNVSTSVQKQERASNTKIAGQKSREKAKEKRISDRPIYINVPYIERKEAKEAGAQWSAKEKSWFIPAGKEQADFDKWKRNEFLNRPPRPDKIYLAVPASDVSEVKKRGAQYDEKKKLYFIDTTKKFDSSLEQWRQETVATITDAREYKEKPKQPAPSPLISKEESLADALREQGLIVPAELHFDGQIHRVAAFDDKGKKQSGYYAAFDNDGRHAGTIGNFKTGQSVTWLYEGNVKQSKAEIEAAKLVAAQRQKDREEKKAQKEEAISQAIPAELSKLQPPKSPNQYMKDKGISLESAKNVKLRNRGRHKNLELPMMDTEGKIWNTQEIYGSEKIFLKGARKTGTFFPINGLESLEKASVIVIAEGFATAASLQEAAKDPSAPALNKIEVITAFDSGNLKPVAEAIRKKFPEKPIILAADDDRHCIMTNGHNVGKEKAEAAAKEVGGRVISPIFSKEVKSWPENVPKFTQKEYRSDNISKEQRSALSDFKKLTDFNDLATKTKLGKDLIKSQLHGEMALLKAAQEKTAEKEISKIHEATKAISPPKTKARAVAGMER